MTYEASPGGLFNYIVLQMPSAQYIRADVAAKDRLIIKVAFDAPVPVENFAFTEKPDYVWLLALFAATHRNLVGIPDCIAIGRKAAQELGAEWSPPVANTFIRPPARARLALLIALGLGVEQFDAYDLEEILAAHQRSGSVLPTVEQFIKALHG